LNEHPPWWTPDPYGQPVPPLWQWYYLIGTAVGMAFFIWFLSDIVIPEFVQDVIHPSKFYKKWRTEHPLREKRNKKKV
jgi:hypothetical protein